MIREAVYSKLLSMAYCLPLASLDDMALCKEGEGFCAPGVEALGEGTRENVPS